MTCHLESLWYCDACGQDWLQTCGSETSNCGQQVLSKKRIGSVYDFSAFSCRGVYHKLNSDVSLQTPAQPWIHQYTQIIKHASASCCHQNIFYSYALVPIYHCLFCQIFNLLLNRSLWDDITKWGLTSANSVPGRRINRHPCRSLVFSPRNLYSWNALVCCYAWLLQFYLIITVELI